MKNASTMTVLGLIVTTGVSLCAPMMVSADGLQQTKNTWRNITVGAAILTGVGIANHNGTETALGAIGTVVAASQYEQDRHQQSVQNNGFCDNGYDRDNGRFNVQIDQDNRNSGRFDSRIDGLAGPPRTAFHTGIQPVYRTQDNSRR